MRLLVLSNEPRPHGPWHTPARHAGCLTHWVQLHLGPEEVVIYPWMFVRGYVMVMEVQTGKRLREILQGNPMWMDETYKVHILEEEGPMTAHVEELPVVPGKQRFLIMARLAKPVPPTVDFAGREEAGRPPLASPIGQILGSQALLHVLSARRYNPVVDQLRELLDGTYGTPPGEVDEAVTRAIRLAYGEPAPAEVVDIDAVRAEADGVASSEEDLLLLALFGDEAKPLLEAIRDRGGEPLAKAGVEQARQERIREIVRIVQESGVAEVTIEEDDLRVTVRRTDDRPVAMVAAAPLAPAAEPSGPDPLAAPAGPVVKAGNVRVESPMVGTFYRAPSPGAEAFVQVGQAVKQGQTLCILEAMKLMNEVKAEIDGIVRAIHVGNAEPVEFGQLLFELEPVGGPPTL